MEAQLSLHEQQMNDLLSRVQIIDERTYTVDGQATQVFFQQPYSHHVSHLSEFGNNEVLGKDQAKSQLLQHLSNTIYTHFYCGVPKGVDLRSYPPKQERDAFMDTLSKSNHSTKEPDKNWRIYAVDHQGNAFAEKNGNLRQVTVNTYVPNPAQPTLAVNQTVDFKRQRENRAAQPVFYHVFGDTFLAPDCSMIRVYWSITPEGAATLVEQVSKVLNDYRIPFNFKCLNHPELYNRNDSAVLYFDKKNLTIVKMLLKPIIEAVRPHLTDKHPLFTDVIDTGVSMAEDPGNGQSFGMSRSSAIASALVGSWEQQIENTQERKESIKRSLRENGISYERMSMNLHSRQINY